VEEKSVNYIKMVILIDKSAELLCSIFGRRYQLRVHFMFSQNHSRRLKCVKRLRFVKTLKLG